MSGGKKPQSIRPHMRCSTHFSQVWVAFFFLSGLCCLLYKALCRGGRWGSRLCKLVSDFFCMLILPFQSVVPTLQSHRYTSKMEKKILTKRNVCSTSGQKRGRQRLAFLSVASKQISAPSDPYGIVPNLPSPGNLELPCSLGWPLNSRSSCLKLPYLFLVLSLRLDNLLLKKTYLICTKRGWHRKHPVKNSLHFFTSFLVLEVWKTGHSNPLSGFPVCGLHVNF